MAARVNNVVLDTAYISVGCNRTPHSLDWGNNGLVCFAASNSVAIYDPKVRQYFEFLILSDTSTSCYIVSTSTFLLLLSISSLQMATEKFYTLSTSSKIALIVSNGFKMKSIHQKENLSVGPMTVLL